MSEFAVFNPQEVQWTDAGFGALKTAVFQGSESLTIQYFELPPKSKGTVRTISAEQIVYIVHGCMGMYCDGKVKYAPQGSLILVPANVPYYGFNPCNYTVTTMKILLPKQDTLQSDQVENIVLSVLEQGNTE